MTNSKVSSYFSSLELAPGRTMRNRIAMAPMTRNRAAEGRYDPNGPLAPTPLTVEYYSQRAKGGAGLIVTEGTLVTRQGTQWENAPGIWSEAQTAGWKKVVDAVHAEGALIFSQLWHVGRTANDRMPEQIRSGKPIYAPSAILAQGGTFPFLEDRPGHSTPVAIEDPREIIAQFTTAAQNAKAAGFDGVELHGANGYLIQQFLDTTSNKRTDSWGGSVENRARFALELIDASAKIFGPKGVGIKLMSSGGKNDVGMPAEDVEETYTYLGKEIERRNIAYIQVMSATAPMGKAMPNNFGFFYEHDAIALFRPLLKNVKLIANGFISIEEGQALIASGKVDAIAFGRLWLNNPDFANRLQRDLPLDTVPMPWPNLQGFVKSPSDGYTDIVPEGGLVGNDHK